MTIATASRLNPVGVPSTLSLHDKPQPLRTHDPSVAAARYKGCLIQVQLVLPHGHSDSGAQPVYIVRVTIPWQTEKSFQHDVIITDRRRARTFEQQAWGTAVDGIECLLTYGRCDLLDVAESRFLAGMSIS